MSSIDQGGGKLRGDLVKSGLPGDDYPSGRNEHFAELRQWIVKRDRKLDGCDAGNGHTLMTCAYLAAAKFGHRLARLGRRRRAI